MAWAPEGPKDEVNAGAEGRIDPGVQNFVAG